MRGILVKDISMMIMLSINVKAIHMRVDLRMGRKMVKEYLLIRKQKIVMKVNGLEIR
jgi:hypothetical protein